MGPFEVVKLSSQVYSILDAGECSFYVVEGQTRAAVIDTGITQGAKIMPLIRTLTDKPLVLAITHAHPDHMHHAAEFEEIYLCHEEQKIPRDFLDQFLGDSKISIADTHDIRTGTKIDLGGRYLEVCQIAGHTPGSVVFWDNLDDFLFTGDAIGSGYGVWLQVAGALPLDQYHENLKYLLKWLVERGGRMTFFGGHNNQQNQSNRTPVYNPLNLGLLADLIDLTDGLVKGTIASHPSAARSFLQEKTYYASFGRAEIEYRRSNIHTVKEAETV